MAEMRVAMHGTPRGAPPDAHGSALEPLFAEAHHEYLVPSAHTDFAEGVRREAREVVAGCGDDASATGSALAVHVAKTFQYVPGATHVGIDVNELQRARRGVCQDFAHYLIALCRAVGLPARYVSGYLFATRGDQSAEPQRGEVTVQTHSWVEMALPGVGWWPLDPTNRLPVGARHVKIGHGRDYEDVQPLLRGLYHGPFQHQARGPGEDDSARDGRSVGRAGARPARPEPDPAPALARLRREVQLSELRGDVRAGRRRVHLLVDEADDAVLVDVEGPALAKRWTFYVDKDGVVRFIDQKVNTATAARTSPRSSAELNFPTKAR